MIFWNICAVIGFVAVVAFGIRLVYGIVEMIAVSTVGWDKWCRVRSLRPIREWWIARRLGLRCLVCNRRAGYGGRCPNEEHNG